MRSFLFASLLLLLIFCPGQLRAENSYADSIEWLTSEAEVVAAGKILDRTEIAGTGGSEIEECTLGVTEMIKGAPASEIKFRDWSRWKEENKARSGDKVIVFLRRAGANDGPLKLCLVFVKVDHPYPVIRLSQLSPDVVDRDGHRLHDGEAVLKLARIWAVSKITNFIDRDCPDRELWRRLEAGSAVFLRVPAEKKYQAEFLKMADSSEERERRQAAEELGKYPGPESEKALRRLLNETTEYKSLYAADDIATIGYPVRTAACKSLKKLGLPVEEVPFERAPTDEERRSLRIEVWTKSLQKALPPDWNLLSVNDGPTYPLVVDGTPGHVQTRPITVVLAELEKDGAKCSLTVAPYEWPAEKLPAGVVLGADSKIASVQGTRIYICDSAMPRAVRDHFIKQYNLSKSTWLQARLPPDRFDVADGPAGK